MAHCQMQAATISWARLGHQWWTCPAQESCRVPGRACPPCSLLPACHRSSRLQTCHTCPRRWCSHRSGSECPCPSLLVGLLSFDTPPWDQRAWTTGKGGTSGTGGQDSGAHLSKGGGGRGGARSWGFWDMWQILGHVVQLMWKLYFTPPEPFL